MTKPNGLHHLAICTADMKAQIAFFTDVLGMELVALYWMHGVEGAWHGFLKLNNRCSIALVYSPDIAKAETEIGKTHSGNPGGPAAPGAMQHLALNVDGMDALLAMRDRIRSRGVNVFGPIDHGFCQSIYFAGPENLSLELSTSAAAIDPAAWIDPEVVALAGIGPAELERYKRPAAYAQPAAPLPQPPMDPARPHMRFPEKTYRRMLAMSDADYTARMSETEPPVKTATAAE
jgi:catechol 2,3-dioxygenase-like lactoylglutathione lyase family enzyme